MGAEGFWEGPKVKYAALLDSIFKEAGGSKDTTVGTESLALARRSHLISQLKNGNGFQEFDVLIIGGGATGLGTALEATRRGLKVALVERGDFACGTSSKSSNM